jgi:6-phosphogluconate dehydrogenase
MESTLPKAQIGVLGLGTMGESLALNIAGKGFPVAVFNRTAEKTKELLGKVDGSMTVIGTYNMEELVKALEAPRKLLLMVTAGQAVDQVVNQVSPLLSKGDVLIDAGNSYFLDTERRAKEAAEMGLQFLGVGVSGGEEGALKGPCVMVGGPKEAYLQVEPILGSIAAKTESGVCCAYLGPGGAGHFTKMVHNGIEYALMELIAEAYDFQATGLGLDMGTVRDNFVAWNEGELRSYLMEITARALSKTDDDTGKPLVQMILDRARQKGTGKWTSQTALDLGVPVPTIDAGVSARNLSAFKEERVRASRLYPSRGAKYGGERKAVCEKLGQALYCSFIISYAQGFTLLRAGSTEFRYDLPFEEIARIWKGGCIIRAKLLDRIRSALSSNPSLENLVVDRGLGSILRGSEGEWRQVVQTIKSLAIPSPAMDSALDYYDAYLRETLPANLIQALRDIFGAHTYERVDRNGSFHSSWV